MTDKAIQKLIDRYLAGTTTPEEERQLARELLRPDIPEDWQTVRLMLGELAMGEAEYDAIMANRQRQTPVIKRMRLRWFSVAASLLLIFGVGMMLLRPTQEKQLDAVVAKVEKQACEAPEVRQEQTLSPQASDSQSAHVGQKVRSRRTNSEMVKASEEVSVAPVVDEADETDPNLHYASHEETSDTVPYQDPCRMNEFIAKLADYYQVTEGLLKCSAPMDSNIVSAVYVFPEKWVVGNRLQEIDLFPRLLQAACWYSDETPGYLLNFSHHQFFFELKDLQKQLQYRWIAERVNGKILLYGTTAPLGAKVTSVCYQAYREELMQIKHINNKSKQIRL